MHLIRFKGLPHSAWRMLLLLSLLSRLNDHPNIKFMVSFEFLYP